MTLFRQTALLSSVTVIGLCACAAQDSQAEATGEAMIAAADPRAAAAGLEVMSEGGTAIDAAIAVQAVLGIVEPQSSGIAGGAFMMVYDAKTKRVKMYDGRETAPASATPKLFYGDDDKRLPYIQGIASGKSTSIAQNYRNMYRGPIAEAIIEASRLTPRPGELTLKDFADYKPRKRDALCSGYKNMAICGAQPPSSGGVAVQAIMRTLANTDIDQYGPQDAQGWHLFIEASRLSYADR